MPQLEEHTSVLTDYGSVITYKGLKKIASAIPDKGERVFITQLAVGDANGVQYEPDQTQNSLVHECWRGSISDYRILKDEPTQLVARGILPPEIGYFVINEVGLFDEDGDLIAIANMPSIPKVPDVSGLGMEMKFNFIVQFEGDVRDKIQIYIVPEAVEQLRDEFHDYLDNFYVMDQKDFENLFGVNLDEDPDITIPPKEDGDCNCGSDCDCNNQEWNIVDKSVIDSWFK